MISPVISHAQTVRCGKVFARVRPTPEGSESIRLTATAAVTYYCPSTIHLQAVSPEVNGRHAVGGTPDLASYPIARSKNPLGAHACHFGVSAPAKRLVTIVSIPFYGFLRSEWNTEIRGDPRSPTVEEFFL